MEVWVQGLDHLQWQQLITARLVCPQLCQEVDRLLQQRPSVKHWNWVRQAARTGNLALLNWADQQMSSYNIFFFVLDTAFTYSQTTVLQWVLQHLSPTAVLTYLKNERRKLLPRALLQGNTKVLDWCLEQAGPSYFTRTYFCFAAVENKVNVLNWFWTFVPVKTRWAEIALVQAANSGALSAIAWLKRHYPVKDYAMVEVGKAAVMQAHLPILIWIELKGGMTREVRDNLFLESILYRQPTVSRYLLQDRAFMQDKLRLAVYGYQSLVYQTIMSYSHPTKRELLETFQAPPPSFLRTRTPNVLQQGLRRLYRDEYNLMSLQDIMPEYNLSSGDVDVFIHHYQNLDFPVTVAWLQDYKNGLKVSLLDRAQDLLHLFRRQWQHYSA